MFFILLLNDSNINSWLTYFFLLKFHFFLLLWSSGFTASFAGDHHRQSDQPDHPRGRRMERIPLLRGQGVRQGERSR